MARARAARLLELPEHILSYILLKSLIAPPSSKAGTNLNLLLVCKAFRAALLRVATSLHLDHDKHLPTFILCERLASLRLEAGCLHWPSEPADSPPRPPQPLPAPALLPSSPNPASTSPFGTYAAQPYKPPLPPKAVSPVCAFVRGARDERDAAAGSYGSRSRSAGHRPWGLSGPLQGRAKRFYSAPLMQRRLVSMPRLKRLSQGDAAADDHIGVAPTTPPPSTISRTLFRSRSRSPPPLRSSSRHPLRYLTSLTDLSFAYESRMHGDEMAEITHLRALRALDVHGCYFVDESFLKITTSLAGLQILNLSGCCGVPEGAWQHLTGLTAVMDLNLRDCGNGSDVRVHHISALSSLQRLNLSHSFDLTDDAMRSLAHLPALRSLKLAGCLHLSNASLEHLSSVSSLQALDLSGCVSMYTGGGLAALRGLRSLQTLRLAFGWPLTDAGLAQLSALPALQCLDLSHCPDVTDGGLSHLSELSALHSLTLAHCRVSSAGLQHLSALTALRVLDLTCCFGVTDAGLSHLAALSALQRLNLCQCGHVSDAGLVHLTGLTALRTINLYECNVTAQGMSRFSGLTALHAEGVAATASALPPVQRKSPRSSSVPPST